MARVCSVCSYSDRGAVDRALVSGTPIRDIAGQHALGKSAVDRHRSHIGAALVEAAERQDAAEDALADDLLEQAREGQPDGVGSSRGRAGNRAARLGSIGGGAPEAARAASDAPQAGGPGAGGAVVYSWRRSSAHEPEVLPAIAERH